MSKQRIVLMYLECLDRLNSEPMGKVVWLVGIHRTYQRTDCQRQILIGSCFNNYASLPCLKNLSPLSVNALSIFLMIAARLHIGTIVSLSRIVLGLDLTLLDLK